MKFTAEMVKDAKCALHFALKNCADRSASDDRLLEALDSDNDVKASEQVRAKGLIAAFQNIPPMPADVLDLLDNV